MIEGPKQDLGPMDLARDFYAAHMEWLSIETERWIWKAIAQGVGNRLWRSHPLTQGYPPVKIHYHFVILKPGDDLPAAGYIMGPFSQPEAE